MKPSFEPELLDEFYDLCEAVLEDDLSSTQAARLEELVLGHPELKKLYVEYLHTSANLSWWNGSPASMPSLDFLQNEPPATSNVDGVVEKADFELGDWAKHSWRRMTGAELTWMQITPYLVSSVVMLVVGLVLGFITGPSPDDATYAINSNSPVATLVSANQCRWESSKLPTAAGARLPAGHLLLAEGLAEILFDNGAKVVLEAPADLEITSSSTCLLKRGRLIATVPPRAVGFRVDTPLAKVVDLGTKFGLFVKSTGVTEVQVFEGAIDLEHLPTRLSQRVAGGQAKRIEQLGIRDFDPLAPEAGQFEAEALPSRTMRQLSLSTADGKGKDTYIMSSPKESTGPETLLMVKNTKGTTHRRKAYIGMDLTPLQNLHVEQAQLTLTLEPTELGFASSVPDATFVVYGLIDETLDGWNPETIQWKTAPANLPGGNEIDTKKAVRLDTFEIAQGIRTGTRSISGTALVEFLNKDTNSIVTFIIVRETGEIGGAGLVHGFASKYHPTSTPPTLKLLVSEP